MFERTMREARYLRAGAVMDLEFQAYLSVWLESNVGVPEGIADRLAESIIDGYLQKLYHGEKP